MSIELLNRFITLTINIAEIILSFFYFYALFDKKHANYIKNFILLFSLLFFIITNQIYYNQITFIIVSLLVYAAIVLTQFAGSLWIRIIASVFFVTFEIIFEVLTALLISKSTNYNIIESFQHLQLYVVGAIISKLLMLIFIKISIESIFKKNRYVTGKQRIILITIPLFSILMIVSLYLPQNLNIKANTYQLFIIIGLLYINFITFALFEEISAKIEENQNLKLANQHLELQQKHYLNLLSDHKVTRGIWHDMRNQLIAIYACLEKELCNQAKENIKSIQKDIDLAMKDVISGNIVVDAILNEKKYIANTYNIKFNMDVLIPQNLLINEMDLCTILGNSLDNALEACNRIQFDQIEKEMNLYMRLNEENLLILLKNTMSPKTLNNKNGIYISTKQNVNTKEHGYGIYNMQRVVEKNGGNLLINANQNEFILNILIPLQEC